MQQLCHLLGVLVLVKVGKHEAKVAEDVTGKESDVVLSANVVDADELCECAACRADHIVRCKERRRLVSDAAGVHTHVHHRVELLSSRHRALSTLTTIHQTVQTIPIHGLVSCLINVNYNRFNSHFMCLLALVSRQTKAPVNNEDQWTTVEYMCIKQMPILLLNQNNNGKAPKQQ